MEKQTVAVLFGGVSPEYPVSLISASSVINNIPKEKYDVLPVGITRDGRWFLFSGDLELIQTDKWCDERHITPAFISPDREFQSLKIIKEGKILNIPIDAVFPVLHGENGEDGSMQGLMQLAGIPCVGCDMTASAAAMDKVIANTIADAEKVRQAKWLYITEADFQQNSDAFEQKCSEYIQYPCFIKPSRAGSSVGISKAGNKLEFINGCREAFKIGGKILVEQAINGHEVECSVLGNDRPVASTVGQIVAANEFYDYDAKYVSDSDLFIPARIGEGKIEEVRERSLQLFKAFGCSGMARIDFFVEKETGEVYFNEINTIPGFTSISMYPKLFAKSGIPYPELLDRLMTLAIKGEIFNG